MNNLQHPWDGTLIHGTVSPERDRVLNIGGDSCESRRHLLRFMSAAAVRHMKIAAGGHTHTDVGISVVEALHIHCQILGCQLSQVE